MKFYELTRKQESEAAVCPPAATLVIRGSRKKTVPQSIHIKILEWRTWRFGTTFQKFCKVQFATSVCASELCISNFIQV